MDVSQVLKPISDILKTVVDVVDGFRERSAKARTSQWDALTDAVDTVEALVREHLSAIQATVDPILQTRDLEATNALYQKLVNDPSFPLGYDEIKGQLEQFRRDRSLGGDVTEAIDQLLLQLTEFQCAAFLIRFDSYEMAAALQEATQLFQRLKGPPALRAEPLVDKLRGDVRKRFTSWPGAKPLGSLMDQQIEETLRLVTADDVARLVAIWCTSWLQHVQRTLYDRRGVGRSIGQVRARRHGR